MFRVTWTMCSRISASRLQACDDPRRGEPVSHFDLADDGIVELIEFLGRHPQL